MGRVVRGMGAIGWEGASDMAVAYTGGIGRLGVSGDGDGRRDGRASGGVDADTAQRRQTPARLGRAGREAATAGCPTKNSRIAEERAARFLLDHTTSLGKKWHSR